MERAVLAPLPIEGNHRLSVFLLDRLDRSRGNAGVAGYDPFASRIGSIPKRRLLTYARWLKASSTAWAMASPRSRTW